MMEDRIKTRIAELEAAETETHMRLVAIRTVLDELRRLLTTDAAPAMSGDPLQDDGT